MATTLQFDLLAKDKASKAFHDVGNAADKTNKKFGGLSGIAKKATGGIGLLGLGLGGVAAGAIAAGKSSFDAFKGFDKTMRQVGAITGESGKSLDSLSGLALKMGKDTTFSAGEASDAMLELAKGGLTSAQIKGGALKQTLTLAAAGGLELGDAATFMSNELNAFGLKAKDAGRVAAALAGGANSSTASVQSLGQALSQVGPGAVNAGLSLNDTVGVLAAFDQAGIKGSDAGTSLKTMLTRLVPSTDKAKSAMEDLGLKFVDAHGSFLDITDIAQQLHDKLGPLSQAQRTSALQTIFGSDATRAATVLMKDGSKGLAKYIKATKDKGAAEKLAKTNTKGASGAMEQLSGSIETLQIKVGKAFAPAVLAVVKGATKVVNFLTDTGLPAIGHFGSAIANKLIPLPKVKKELSDAKDYLSDFLKGLFGKDITPKNLPTKGKGGGLFAQMILPTPSKAAQMGQQIHDMFSGGISAGIKAIDWGQVGTKIAAGLGTALSNLAGLGSKFSKSISTILGKIDWADLGGKVGAGAVGFALGFLSHLGDDLFTVDFWKKHWLDVIVGVLAIVPVGKLVGAAGKVLSKIPWGKLLEGIGKLITKVPWQRMFPFLPKLSEASGALLSSVGRFVGRVAGGLVGAFTRRFPKVAAEFGKQLGLLPTRLGIAAIRLGEQAGRIPEKIQKAIAKKVPGLLRWVTKIFTKFTLFNAGINLVAGLLNGLAQKAKDIGHWVKSHLLDPLYNTVLRYFGIHSPSTKFAAIGRNIIQGLINGIRDFARRPVESLTNIGGRMRRVFSRAASWLVSEGRGVVSGLRSGILDRARGFYGWVRDHVVHPVTHAFANAADWLVGAGSRVIGGLKSGMSDRLGNAKDWFASIGHKIVSGVKNFFGIHSPSTVFAGLGGHLISGMVKGMLNANPVAMAKKVFGSMTGALKHMVSSSLIGLGNLSGKALKALGGLFGGPSGSPSGSNQRIAAAMLSRFGWGQSQFGALKRLWQGESGWNERALNASSGAYGIPQALPASKMASAGSDWRTNPATQIAWGLRYIKDRYGSPSYALARWNARNPHWYGAGLQGGVFNSPTLIGVGERGPERVDVTPLSQPQQRGGDTHLYLTFTGPVGSQRELETWLVRALDDLGRKGRVPRSLAVARR